MALTAEEQKEYEQLHRDAVVSDARFARCGSLFPLRPDLVLEPRPGIENAAPGAGDSLLRHEREAV